MVHVGDVEELGHRSINVGRRWARGSGVGEDIIVRAAAAGPVVGEVGVSTGRVRLGDGIVSTSDRVAGRSSAVPSEFGGGRVLRVGDSLSAAFAGVVNSEGAVVQSAWLNGYEC